MKFDIKRQHVIIALVLLVSLCLGAAAFPLGVVIGGTHFYYQLATEQQRVVSAMLAEDDAYANVDASRDSRGYAVLNGNVDSPEILQRLKHDLIDLYGEKFADENISRIEIAEH